VITVPFDRRKVLRWTWTVLLVCGAVWLAHGYVPAARAIGAREGELAQREARVRQARAAAVVLGPAGLDSALARFRSDSALLALRVPADSVAPALASELKAVLGAREGRGLKILRTDPVQVGREDGFSGAGYSVTAVGRFAEIRGLLGDLAAQPRLLRVRRLHLVAVPDSLLACAHAPDGGPGLPADTASAPDHLATAGAQPFEAVVSFEVVWYTRPSSHSAVRDSAGAAPSTSSALLP
jgi:Tfp pilus assembly protein PilO